MYDYVIVHEASEVTNENFFLMLNCIAYSAYPHDCNWPKKVFCVDLYQLLPNTGVQHLGSY